MITKNFAFEKWKGEIELDHLSASSAGSWIQCGLQWKLYHLDGINLTKVPSHFVFGSAFHKGLEPWWMGRDPNFHKPWSSYRDSKVQYYGRQSWESLYSMGMKMTSATKAVTEGRFGIVSPDEKKDRIEKTETVDLGFIKVERRIDLILEAKKMPILLVDSGEIVRFEGDLLIDVKTSAREYGPEKILYSGQLKTYAIPSNGKQLGERLSAYLVITKSANPTVQIIGKMFTKEEIKTQIKTIKHVAEQIREGVFTRREGDHCNFCNFFDLCYNRPGWEQKYYVRKKNDKKSK